MKIRIPFTLPLFLLAMLVACAAFAPSARAESVESYTVTGAQYQPPLYKERARFVVAYEEALRTYRAAGRTDPAAQRLLAENAATYRSAKDWLKSLETQVTLVGPVGDRFTLAPFMSWLRTTPSARGKHYYARTNASGQLQTNIPARFLGGSSLDVGPSPVPSTPSAGTQPSNPRRPRAHTAPRPAPQPAPRPAPRTPRARSGGEAPGPAGSGLWGT